MIKGQVPEFSQEDVQLSWYIGDEKQTTPFPTKGGEYSGVSVTCEKGATAEWSNAIWGLVNINPNGHKKVYCSVVFERGNTIADNDVKNSNVKCNANVFGVEGKCTTVDLQVGDLVSYTPPEGSDDNIPSSWTACPEDNSKCHNQSNQTIHPEYNKLWRVINKNADGTVDIISEYSSNNYVCFYGKEGYRIFVDGLNNIANLYKNDTYILSARNIGYNGQTGSIASTAAAIITTSNPSPFEATIGNNNEPEGGGDIKYQYDIGQSMNETDYGSKEGLVYKVYKTVRGNNLEPLIAYKTNTDGTNSMVKTYYWLASRRLDRSNSGYWVLRGRYVGSNGAIGASFLWNPNGNNDECGYFRPILTLKSGLTLTEDNTSEAQWKIN